MAEETYTVELLVDTGSSVATVQALGNLIAKLKADFPELGAVLGRVEAQLGKFAGTATAAATATDKLAASQAKTASSLTRASQDTAIYNQYLYDEVKALTGVSLSLDKLTEANYEAAKAEALAARNTQLYNQALFEQEALLRRTGQSLSTTRYALFSAAGSIAAFSGVLLALSLAPALIAVSFQKEFAQVTRTVTGAGDDVKQALIGLSEAIPVSFKSLAGIAALGGQLGINKDGIVQFTKTVAELTATTNLSADAAGTFLGRFEAFGLINNSQFENLASSVLKLGVSTVATETQITSIATRIAGIGKIAGLSAAEIVGLSGAIASAGVQPYLASGTVSRLFVGLSQEVLSGGAKLDEFAKLARTSSDTVAKAFGTDKFGPIFKNFLVGMQDVSINGGSAATALQALGIHSINDIKTFTQLAALGPGITNYFKLAQDGLDNTSTMASQFGLIADTTASRIKILGNSVEAFFNSIGSAQNGILGDITSGLSGFFKELTALNGNPAGQTFLGIASTVGVLAGALGLLTAVGFRAYAGIIGITQGLGGLRTLLAEAALEGSTATGAIAALRAELELSGTAGLIASKGIGAAVIAMKGLGIAAIAAAGVLVLSFETQGANKALMAATGQVDSISGALKRLKGAKDDAGSMAGVLGFGNETTLSSNMGGINSFLFDVARQFANFNLNLDSTVNDIRTIDDAFAKLAQNGGLNTARAEAQSLADAQGITVDQLLTKLPSFTAELKAEGVAFEEVNVAVAKVNAGKATTLDITKALNALTNETPKEQDAFAKAYTKSTDSLTSFNSIVKEVQDGLNAKAQAEAKATKSTKDSAASYYDGSVSLDQYTAQLEANNVKQREWSDNLNNIGLKDGGGLVVQQLVSAGYSVVNASLAAQLANASDAQWIAYMAATVKGIDLASAAAAQRLTAGGFLRDSQGNVITSGSDLGKRVGDAFANGWDMPDIMKAFKLTLDGTPLPVSVDTGPATRTIQEFIHDVSGRRIPVNVDPSIASAQSILDQFIASNNGRTIALNATVGGSVPKNLRQYISPLGPASGGYINGPGTGTSDSIPAMISNGEYVIKAASVRQYGAGLFDALNRGVARFASGGYVGQSQQAAPMSTGAGVNIQVVQNNPVTRDPIRQLKDDAANVLAGIWS